MVGCAIHRRGQEIPPQPTLWNTRCVSGKVCAFSEDMCICAVKLRSEKHLNRRKDNTEIRKRERGTAVEFEECGQLIKFAIELLKDAAFLQYYGLFVRTGGVFGKIPTLPLGEVALLPHQVDSC